MEVLKSANITSSFFLHARCQILKPTSSPLHFWRPSQTCRVVLYAAPAQEHPRTLLPRSSSPQLLKSWSLLPRSSVPRAGLLRSLLFGSIKANSSLGADQLQRTTSDFFQNFVCLNIFLLSIGLYVYRLATTEQSQFETNGL